MSTHSLDLDLSLPTDIPDLPPPWLPTDVAIEWWAASAPQGPDAESSLGQRLTDAHRAHCVEPFVLN